MTSKDFRSFNGNPSEIQCGKNISPREFIYCVRVLFVILALSSSSKQRLRSAFTLSQNFRCSITSKYYDQTICHEKLWSFQTWTVLFTPVDRGNKNLTRQAASGFIEIPVRTCTENGSLWYALSNFNRFSHRLATKLMTTHVDRTSAVVDFKIFLQFSRVLSRI